MLKLLQSISAALVLAGVSAGVARADSYDDTIHTFKQAGKSGTFFAKAYGYAVFPTVGGAGFVVGAAHGKGRVYAHGILTGDTTVNLLSAGLQAGAKAYSEIIFFEDKRALDEFESGWRRQLRSQRRVVERQHQRQLLQRHGGVHDRQRRPDVRGDNFGPEVYLYAPGWKLTRISC